MGFAARSVEPLECLADVVPVVEGCGFLEAVCLEMAGDEPKAEPAVVQTLQAAHLHHVPHAEALHQLAQPSVTVSP
jgi:hypothetical protein